MGMFQRPNHMLICRPSGKSKGIFATDFKKKISLSDNKIKFCLVCFACLGP